MEPAPSLLRGGGKGVTSGGTGGVTGSSNNHWFTKEYYVYSFVRRNRGAVEPDRRRRRKPVQPQENCIYRTLHLKKKDDYICQYSLKFCRPSRYPDTDLANKQDIKRPDILSIPKENNIDLNLHFFEPKPFPLE